MTLLEDCQKFFDTKNLYDVLRLKRSKKKLHTESEVKKAYYRLSLEIHPDRSQLVDAKERFQTLGRVYAVLSDKEKRAIYDDTGAVDEDEISADFCDLVTAFKRYFAEITPEEIDRFKEEYVGSEQERLDAIVNFKQAEGDMNEFYERQMFAEPLEDEERFRAMFSEMIEKGTVEPYPAFVGETEKKRKARKRKWEKEREEAEQIQKESSVASEEDLAKMIQSRQANRMNDLASHLEQKYGGGRKGRK